MAISLTGLLSEIPESLRDDLIKTFQNIERNFREGRWEPSELNGGKLCEVVYWILRGYVDGTYPISASKPLNMVVACKSLELSASTFPRSVRIQIPRILIALYEIRNNRGVGHVGGDVDPNHMDAVCVLQMSKWVVAELIRVFHNVTIEEATATVEAMSDREITLVWKIGGVSRVLDTSMSMLDKTLLLLYGAPLGLPERELVLSIEHSNPSVYRSAVLRKAHAGRLIEYDSVGHRAIISPLGSEHVENTILV